MILNMQVSLIKNKKSEWGQIHFINTVHGVQQATYTLHL